MTTNDLYVRMLVDHPIQGEWKPTIGDKTAELGVIAGYYNRGEAGECLTWLPTQDQWQEKYENYRKTKLWSMERFIAFYHIQLTSIEAHNLHEWFTILWCLFVSKEVYGLEWDWEESKWIKA